jgi:pimeloyl-ACP methyl ester carboxylesterase
VSPLWAEEAGDSEHPLVVMIHGSMDRSAGMLKLSRRLDTDFRVLRYDRRGYGRSFPHAGPFSMDAQVTDLVELLAGRKAVLVGHSYGGDIALTAADRHADLVAGAAVYEMPLSWEPWWPRTTAGSLAVAESGEPEAAAERFLRRMLGDQRWEALPERTKDARRGEGLAMIGELSDLGRARPWDPERITVPVVTAFGSLGAPHHHKGMRHAADLLGCPLVELSGCRHDAPLSHPDLFRTEVIDPLMRWVGPPWSAGRSTERPAQRP